LEIKKMESGIKVTGKLDIIILREDGKVEKYNYDNLVVTVGKNHIADQLSDKGEAVISHMAIGTGTNTQVIGDTALQTELHRKALTSKVQGAGVDANKVVYTGDWAPGEGTGAITEAGLFNAVAAGVMMTRTTFAVKNKAAGDSISIQWTLSIN
jgi:hypothetical protein